MSLPLLPGWPEVLTDADLARKQAAARVLLPQRTDLPTASAEIRQVENFEEARALIAILQSTPVSAIAIDSEYSFKRPEIELRSGNTWADIRSQRPICVSLAAWVGQYPKEERYLLRAVLDVRAPAVVMALEEILRLRVPFLFHNVKAELFTLWSLGLEPDLQHLYDTYLAAACLHLGLDHRRSWSLHESEEDDAEKIHAKADLARRKIYSLSLVGQCEQYQLGYPYSGDKEELRTRFLTLEPTAALTQRMLEYSAADAEWTLRLYVAQQPEVILHGIDHHLRTIEFPFAVANARMEWRGVHVAPDERDKLREATKKAADCYASELRGFGIDPPGSRRKLLDVMRRAGLVDHFRRDGKYSTRQELLEELEGLHPAIRPFRLHHRYRRMASEEWLTGLLTGADGRIHPCHRQLGADTGRNSCTTPNIAGIGRVLRPVVTAPPGRALIELDYSQIEVGVAAAEHNDPDLIAAYNSSDVYSSMALRFYASRLTPEERELAPAAFKKMRPDLRNAMKTFVLAVMFNIQAPGIAARFGIKVEEAERERIRFLDLFPVLKRRLEESSVYGATRGYSAVVSGLRRRLETMTRPSSWTRNSLRNTPIQGSAAVVFKSAVIRLDQAFRGTDTWLVLPVHDAILIECAAEQVAQVGERAAQIMKDALRGAYPKVEPKVDVNSGHPECWNKDGHADSLTRWIEDPRYSLK